MHLMHLLMVQNLHQNLDLKLALLEQILNMGTTKAEIERAKLVLAKGEKIAPKTHKFCFQRTPRAVIWRN